MKLFVLCVLAVVGISLAESMPKVRSCDVVQPENGSALPAGSVRVGTRVRYACKAGFKRVGRAKRLCKRSGNLHKSMPVCVEIQKEASQQSCTIPRIPDTVKMVSYNNNLNTGDTVQFTCVDACQVMSGKSIVTCQSNGTLSSSLPTCSSSCKVGLLSNNVKVTPSSGHVEMGKLIYFRCTPGYQLVGVKKTKCGCKGKFESTLPKCHKQLLMNFLG